MVKNSKGGYHKANARKDSAISSHKTRFVSDPSERYAKVTKLFGGNRCSVISSDGDTLSCVIRGKFSGKFKHSNLLSIDSFILVGIHQWASDKSICDLLHVYQPHDLVYLYPSFPSFFNPQLSDSFNLFSTSSNLSNTPSNHSIDHNHDHDHDFDLSII